MYTRIVECNVRPTEKDKFARALNEEILVLLKKQPGFQDLMVLWSESEPNRSIAISTWDNKESADTYYQNDYHRVVDILTSMINGKPKVETYTVDSSTAHRIAHSKAA